MAHLNVEVKGRCKNPGFIRNYLVNHRAEFKGTDHQTDTYFNTKNGRLKLREGNIENNLIYYERDNKTGPKNSNFQLIKVDAGSKLKEALTKSLGVKIIVEKKREIYYIENVKFHIDQVPGLGSFIEIEASTLAADISEEKLREQCEYYMKEFGIQDEDLLPVSYSDLLLTIAE